MIRSLLTLSAVLAILAVPASAGCPAPADIGAEARALFAKLRDSESEREARVHTNQLWELWAKAPDEAAQDILDTGMRYRRDHNFLAALDSFDKLIEYCPDYAEGYNQRAFVLFLQGEYAKALTDLDAALEINPEHVAAMAGKGLTLIGLGELDAGRVVLEEALEINPWLPERRLLPGLKDEGQAI